MTGRMGYLPAFGQRNELSDELHVGGAERAKNAGEKPRLLAPHPFHFRSCLAAYVYPVVINGG